MNDQKMFNTIECFNFEKLLIFGEGEFADIADQYFAHDSEYHVEAFVVDGSILQR